MNDSGGQVKISAIKKAKRALEPARQRGGENVLYKRLQSLDAEVLKAKGISREVFGVLGRWLFNKDLTPMEGEAGRHYAYITARFDKYFTEGRRDAKSQSYERAYGADQELERRGRDGTIEEYTDAAKKARKRYDKLMKIMALYGSPLKNAIDDMCCSDIEPPAAYRAEIAAVLRHIGKKFGLKMQSRRGRRRKEGG